MKQENTEFVYGEAASKKLSFWYDTRKRAIVYQIMFIAALGGVCFYLFYNIETNLNKQSIATGFGFLGKQSGFAITESLVPHAAPSSYAHALMVGLINTLEISFIGIVLTMLLGTIMGIARLSRNWLVSRLAGIYIEVLRDIPVLLQLFFWYAVFYQNLPSPRQPISIFGSLFLCNRGMFFPIPVYDPVYVRMALAFLPACLATIILRRWAKKRHVRTGRLFPWVRVSLIMLIGLPVLLWVLAGAPLKWNIPRLAGFNFDGGISISPEFAALLLGLVLYTSAFVAEIVRTGIQSVSRGQTEAAMALGLKPFHILKLVILPQALRVIIPPLTSEMLNLIKNSSLAIAIGYPDFVAVANTTINQTGQAIEGVAMIMAVYLCFSLPTSGFMNWYNKKVALVER
jgi:general L-amino acid transport system permease protein